MSHRSYYLSRSPHRATIRAGWISPSTGDLYCGICLRSVLAPHVGAECPSCGSVVERVFEVAQGGVIRPLGPRQNRAAAYIAAKERVGKVVTR